MANIFFGLNIGRSALLTNQTAMDVTGHNLANVQTDGYSRQRATIVQGLPIATSQGPQGSGVNVERIQRLQVGYLERQISKANTQEGYNSTLSQGLDQLQSLLGEPSTDGIGGALTGFWNSWEALSAQPSDASLRAQVVDQAQHLALVYNQKIQGFMAQEATLEDAIAGDVSDVNAWGKQIAALNKSIMQVETSGYSANDLRDQRDQLVQQVSQKIGVDTEVDGPNVNLRLPNGGPYIVQGMSNTPIATNRDASGAVSGLLVGAIPVAAPGGSVGAFLELRNQASPGLRSQLAELAATVVDRVNALHVAGYDRDGVPGGNLFAWDGTADATALASGQGVQEVVSEANLEPGTHLLQVASVSPNLVANTRGSAPAGSIVLTQTGGAFDGPRSINLDYHVRILSANTVAGSLDGARAQLFRGDEAVGDAQALSGAGPAVVAWSGVDGVDFSATISFSPGQSFFAAEARSDGLSTIGAVSLDGGPPVDVDLTTQNNLSFAGGSNSEYAGGGTVNVNFSGAPFSGATFTRYGAAEKLYVRPEIVADTDKLAAASRPPNAANVSATGDGEIARQMGDLATRAIFDQIGETASGFLGKLVQALGSKGRDAQVFAKASTTISTQLATQRQATSGVSTDEEMVNLMQYQRGFEAAARFLSTVDSLIETLINRVGAGA